MFLWLFCIIFLAILALFWLVNPLWTAVSICTYESWAFFGCLSVLFIMFATSRPVSRCWVALWLVHSRSATHIPVAARLLALLSIAETLRRENQKGIPVRLKMNSFQKILPFLGDYNFYKNHYYFLILFIGRIKESLFLGQETGTSIQKHNKMIDSKQDSKGNCGHNQET